MKQPETENLPDWDEMMQRYLAKLSPKERLAGLDPEERLAMLRMLLEDDGSSLPAEVQEEIRKRLH